jgi:hypothetical protein
LVIVDWKVLKKRKNLFHRGVAVRKGVLFVVSCWNDEKHLSSMRFREEGSLERCFSCFQRPEDCNKSQTLTVKMFFIVVKVAGIEIPCGRMIFMFPEILKKLQEIV